MFRGHRRHLDHAAPEIARHPGAGRLPWKAARWPAFPRWPSPLMARPTRRRKCLIGQHRLLRIACPRARPRYRRPRAADPRRAVARWRRPHRRHYESNSHRPSRCPDRRGPAAALHSAREPVEVAPIDEDAGGAPHGDQVDRMIGGAAPVASSPDHGVDDSAVVGEYARIGDIGVAPGPSSGRALRRRRWSAVAQRPLSGCDEGRAGHMQAHDLRNHPIAVGGAVEGAGAGAVINCALWPQAVLRGRRGRRVWLADARLLLVRQAATPSVPRHEDDRQMSRNAKAPHRQAGHDLVADASIPWHRRYWATAQRRCPSRSTSRENSDSSMPGLPCVTPSHIAGTPPALLRHRAPPRATSRINRPDSVRSG